MIQILVSMNQAGAIKVEGNGIENPIVALGMLTAASHTIHNFHANKDKGGGNGQGAGKIIVPTLVPPTDLKRGEG